MSNPNLKPFCKLKAQTPLFSISDFQFQINFIKNIVETEAFKTKQADSLQQHQCILASSDSFTQTQVSIVEFKWKTHQALSGYKQVLVFIRDYDEEDEHTTRNRINFKHSQQISMA